MTYNVLMGMLNPTHSLTRSQVKVELNQGLLGDLVNINYSSGPSSPVRYAQMSVPVLLTTVISTRAHSSCDNLHCYFPYTFTGLRCQTQTNLEIFFKHLSSMFQNFWIPLQDRLCRKLFCVDCFQFQLLNTKH